jgi:hypothetical protein
MPPAPTIRLTNAQEVLRLHYLPAYDPHPQPDNQLALPITTQADLSGISQEQLRQGFRQRLEALRREEIGVV